MPRTKYRYMFITLIVFIFVSVALYREVLGEDNRRMPPPPPEAYTACEGKNAGDTAEFVGPRGDKVTGTCKQQGDRLFLVPDNPPPHGRQNSSNQKG